ncbi:hypothetical protein Bca52824_027669 [Brassica carinata]|uniref:MADS-box domain-containing protein n=1 Tax=Brassica carinata TaxID=52824 RepID=A0A8X7VAX5_BRACI|nr:hypothetical protein Bca52824_027669 [Brassica carinata]
MRPPISSSSSSSSSYSLAASSLNSRLLTIFKKAQELTTLCDIEACVIHYGPDGELKTWPENRDKTQENVNLYEFLNKNKEKKKKTMSNAKRAKKNVEELKYPISDHYSPDQISQLIQSLELSYSKLHERRQSMLKNQEPCVYDQNNFQHLCVSDYSAVQESGLHYQLMPYGGYYDQNMCTGNNFQDPCVSSIQDYSVFPLELQESVSNYGLNQLMQRELYGFDQNMCMGDTTNINYSGFMVGNPVFSQDFNPDMSSSYVDEIRLLQASTLPSL